jgi:hypothetical protein
LLQLTVIQTDNLLALRSNQRGGAGRGRAKCKDDRAIDAYPLPEPEYPFSSHVFGATDGDTRDQQLIEHSEKRLSGRFYLLLFLQFHGCSDKLSDRLMLQPEMQTLNKS